jgi:class 3 adenylate cyclase
VERSANLTSIDVIASALEPGNLPVSRLSSPDGAMTLMLSDIANAERVLEHHDGRVVRFERDGFLASFDSAHGGLHAAVDLQRTFGSDGRSDSSGPELRIGVHSGFVITGEEDLLGRNVVLTSRIAAHAKAGEILVSSALKQYTENDPGFQFEDRGEHHFKGLLGEHGVYSVRWR